MIKRSTLVVENGHLFQLKLANLENELKRIYQSNIVTFFGRTQSTKATRNVGNCEDLELGLPYMALSNK